MANTVLASRLRSLRTALLTDTEGAAFARDDAASAFSPLLAAAVAIHRAHHASSGTYMSAKVFGQSFLALVTSDEAVRQFAADKTMSPKEVFAVARISQTPDLLSLAFPEIVLHEDELAGMPVIVFVEMLYRIFLGRRGEPDGVSNWERQIVSGESDHAGVLAAIAGSAEAAQAATGQSIQIVSRDQAANAAYCKAARRFQSAELDRLHDLAVLVAMATE